MGDPVNFSDPTGLFIPCTPPAVPSSDGSTCVSPDPGGGGGGPTIGGPTTGGSGGGNPGGTTKNHNSGSATTCPTGTTRIANGPCVTPKQIQCLQQAEQAYKNAQAAVINNTIEGVYLGGGVAIGAQLVAGCLVGTGAGTILGGLGTLFLGGEGSFAGAPVGCIVGAADAVLEGLSFIVVTSLITAAVIYVKDEHDAVNQYNQAIQACEQ
jgi:hypothetical protein